MPAGFVNRSLARYYYFFLKLCVLTVCSVPMRSDDRKAVGCNVGAWVGSLVFGRFAFLTKNNDLDCSLFPAKINELGLRFASKNMRVECFVFLANRNGSFFCFFPTKLNDSDICTSHKNK